MSGNSSKRVEPFRGQAPSTFYYLGEGLIHRGALPFKDGFVKPDSRLAYLSTNSTMPGHSGFMVHNGFPHDPGHPVSVFEMRLGRHCLYFVKQGRPYSTVDQIGSCVNTGLRDGWLAVILGEEVRHCAGSLDALLLREKRVIYHGPHRPEKPYKKLPNQLTFFPTATTAMVLSVHRIGERDGDGLYEVIGEGVSFSGDPNEVQDGVEKLFRNGLADGTRQVQFQLDEGFWLDYLDNAIVIGARNAINAKAQQTQK